MKRAVAVILAVVTLLLCGCSNKVEEAQTMFDSGDYYGAIGVAEEILGEDYDDDAVASAIEIKAMALYELQQKAYNEGDFSSAVKYYIQIEELGSDTSVYYKAQKIDTVISAEQELETMHKVYDSGLWDNAVDCEKEIQRLSKLKAMTYGEEDALNSRMNEILSESEALSQEAQRVKWYDEFLSCVEIGYAEGAVRAAETIHAEWPGSEEDIAVQESLPQALEQIEQKHEEEKQELRDIIRVSRVWTTEPDFLGATKLFINFTNTSDKTIKYITFEVRFYNAVGDVVECEINGWRPGDSYRCQYTGPCEPGDGLSGKSLYWGSYYNSTIDYPELISVEIEYMDGSTVYIDGDDINVIQY